MKLMVAGCSYSAPSQQLPGTSWSEVLAQQLGWELVNLARQGCSNGGIRVQIDEIIRQRPDFAIVTPTFHDRMEIPATAAPFDWKKSTNGWAPDIQRHLQDRTLKNGYNRDDGINNINYGNNNYNMICETIYTLAENFPHPYRSGHISRTAQTAVRHYIDAIYDSEWKKQQDEWIIREGILMLHLSGIQFVVQPNFLWPFNPDYQSQWRNAFPSMIPDHCIQLDPRTTVQALCGNHPFDGEDPGYHSSPAGQAVIAAHWRRHMQQHFGL